MLWAILRDHLDRILQADVDLFADAPVADIDAMYAARGDSRQGNGVAVLPIIGPVSKRDTMMTMLFGGTSTNRLIAQMRTLAADDSVSTVILNVDSPGGTISGVPEAAAEVRRLRESKRVIAISNDLMASAAFWIASQADEIHATPESLTGSVGVFAAHVDVSEALGKEGVKVTLISSSPEKVEGNEFAPLDDDARDHMQSLVDSAMDLFVADVAKGRGVTPATVRSGFGKGRVLDAKGAKTAGLVDRIGTFSDVLARPPRGRRAEGGPVLPGDSVVLLDGEVVERKAEDDTDLPVTVDEPEPDDIQARRDEVLRARWRLHR